MHRQGTSREKQQGRRAVAGMLQAVMQCYVGCMSFCSKSLKSAGELCNMSLALVRLCDFGKSVHSGSALCNQKFVEERLSAELETALLSGQIIHACKYSYSVGTKRKQDPSALQRLNLQPPQIYS